MELLAQVRKRHGGVETRQGRQHRDRNWLRRAANLDAQPRQQVRTVQRPGAFHSDGYRRGLYLVIWIVQQPRHMARMTGADQGHGLGTQTRLLIREEPHEPWLVPVMLGERDQGRLADVGVAIREVPGQDLQCLS